ncbi:MAG: phosphoribosyltransferase [Blastocatellia bacterium]
MTRRFRDRAEAGQLLAEQLRAYAGRPDVLVLALPRGGVPVGYEIAMALGVPLDVMIVRKLGTPGQEELALGAIASGGVRVMNADALPLLSLSGEDLARVIAREQRELERRERLYRGQRPFPDIHGKTVLLVDDGIATGATMRAAVAALKQMQPAKIVVATPVAAPSACAEIRAGNAQGLCVCLETPEPFFAIGLWYDDFGQTTDEEVRGLLARVRRQETDA